MSQADRAPRSDQSPHSDRAPHPGKGIDFSLAVMIRTEDGKLVAEVPPQVAERLAAGAGDVLCWTGFEDGTIEAWSVKKSPYASLDDGVQP